jgi:single-strand DNA-binding protein
METSKSNLNVNTVYVGGHITADPEYKTTGGGVAIANMTVAVNRSYKQGEEWKKEVEFVRIKLFGKFADTAKGILSKGDTVLITGRIHTSSWEDNGVKKYMTEVIAENMQKVDPKIDLGPKKEKEEEIETVEDEPDNEIDTKGIPF